MRLVEPQDTDMVVTAGIALACLLGVIGLYVWKLVIEPLLAGAG